MQRRTVVRLAAVLGASVMVLTGMTGSVSAAEPGTMAVGTQIKNVATGRCLDSNYAGDVYTSPCAGDHNNAYQQWIGEWGGSKYYLRNVQTARWLQYNGTSVRTVDWYDENRAWTTAVGAKQQYNFRPYGTALNLDSDAKGNVYLKEMNQPTNDNPYQQWWFW